MMLQIFKTPRSLSGASKVAFGRGARALALGAIVLAATVAGFAPQPRAATFKLESGKEIYGEIIHATRSAIMIKSAYGAILQLSLSDIEEIGIKLRTGKVITGALKSWSNKTYAVAVEGRLLKIQQARLVADEALQEEATVPRRTAVAAPPSDQPPKAEKKTAKPQPELTATVEIPPVSKAEAPQETAVATAAPVEPLGEKLSQMKADRLAVQSALTDSQRLNEKLVQTMEARAMEAAKLRGELTLAKQIIDRQKAAFSEPASQVETLNGKLSSMYDQKQKLEAALKESQETKLAAERSLSQAEADIMGLLDDTEAYRSRSATFRLKLDEAAYALETVRRMLKKSENEKQNLQIELNEVRSKVERLSANLDAAEADRKKEGAEAADLAKELARAKQAIEEMRSIAEVPAAQN